MPVGKISFNVHAQGVRDIPALKAVLSEIDPAALLVMDGLGLLLELKSIHPNMIAIDREYPDTVGFRNIESPLAWLNRKEARVGTKDIWVYTTNEPLLTDEIVAWHVELIKLNAQRLNPLKLVILNLSVGNPNSWANATELLQLADKYRQWCIVGLHEYSAVVPTSGFKGGTPEDQGYSRAEQWPRGANLEAIKPPRSGMFHCGRVFAMNEFCKTHGITPPRVILTEHGFDHLGDLEAWYSHLQRTYPYPTIGGWKSLVNQWKIFFPQWSEGRVLFEALSYLDSELYKGSNVEAQLIFCWGWIDQQWEGFDVSTNTVFHSFLKDYVRNLLMTTPVTPFVPRPNPAGLSKKVVINAKVNVRVGNGTKYAVQYTTEDSAELLLYRDTKRWDDLHKYEWVWIEPTAPNKAAGWIALINPIDVLFTEVDAPPPVENYPNLPPFPPAIDTATLTKDQKWAAANYLQALSDYATYLVSILRKDC